METLKLMKCEGFGLPPTSSVKYDLKQSPSGKDHIVCQTLEVPLFIVISHLCDNKI